MLTLWWSLVVFLLAAGLLFFTGGSVGILRLPDFYTRLHAAGKLDTMGSFTMMLALALANAWPLSLAAVLTSLKILLAMVFVFVANPTATHAIVDAGIQAGQTPWVKGGGPIKREKA
jgi:multicomponent Na+:H+ antiporter subunit G